MSTHKKCFYGDEAIQMSTHKICFYGEIKNIPKLSSDTLLYLFHCKASIH